MFRIAGKVFVFAYAVVAMSSAAAADRCGAELDRKHIQVDIRVLNLDLAKAMSLLAEQAKISIVLNRGLNARLKQQHLNGSLKSVLNNISAQVGTVWWWRDNELHMESRSDSVSRALEFPRLVDLVDAAKRLCLPVEALEFRQTKGGGLIRVSGPSGVVREVEDLAKSLRESYGRARVTRYGRQRYQKLY